MKRWMLSTLFVLLGLVTTPLSAALVLYGATGSGGAPSTLFTIDANTGVATPVGPIGFSITGLAFDPTTGILYGGTSPLPVTVTGFHGLVRIDPTTGAGSAVGAYGSSPGAMSDITFDAAGNLFGYGTPGFDLFRINKLTGAATFVGDSPGTGLAGLAFSRTGTLFLDTGGFLFTLNPGTGASTAMVGSAGRMIGAAMDFDENNVLYALERISDGATGLRNLVTVNTSTAAATTIGPTTPGLDALAFRPAAITAAVPEPSGIVLLATAALLMFLATRRRAAR